MRALMLPGRIKRGCRCSFQWQLPRRMIALPSKITLTAHSRALTTATSTGGFAAPEIKNDDEQALNARLVPASPSYFTGRPDFTDNLLALQSMLRKYESLPVVPPGQAPRVAWRTLAQYRVLVGEQVKSAKYHKILQLL